jgi:hypothetical protein
LVSHHVFKPFAKLNFLIFLHFACRITHQLPTMKLL